MVVLTGQRSNWSAGSEWCVSDAPQGGRGPGRRRRQWEDGAAGSETRLRPPDINKYQRCDGSFPLIWSVLDPSLLLLCVDCGARKTTKEKPVSVHNTWCWYLVLVPGVVPPQVQSEEIFNQKINGQLVEGEKPIWIKMKSNQQDKRTTVEL